MKDKINAQLSIWDSLLQEAPIEDVDINGAVNLNSRPISEYKVRLAYGDLTLIVAMIEDYVKGLDEIKKDDIQWDAYYKPKFRNISQRIQEQIEYDYQSHLEKCIKKREKESSSDIGEEAMALMIKRSKKKEDSVTQS